MNLTICYLKIDISCEASVTFHHISQNATPATEFVRCHQPLHAALTMRFAKNAQHDTSKALRFPRKMMMEVAKVLRLPRKMQLIFLKRHESIAPATQNDCQHVMKHVGLSRSAMPAMRNKATRHWKLPQT